MKENLGEFITTGPSFSKIGRSARICRKAVPVSGGSTPDLRHMSKATHAEFDAVVLGGARAERGMVSFADVVTREDADAVHAYLIKRARDDWQGEPLAER